MTSEALKVGELASRTGLTIRALHHYDEIGLLKPSLHTESGYRLYTAADVVRLQQVLSLRQLGFSLDEIRDCLDGRDFSPLALIRDHAARLREQIDLQQKLCQRLETLAEHVRAAGEISTEELIRTIEVMTMIENYFLPEQLEYLKQRGEQLGDERTRTAPTEWTELIALVRAEMKNGTAPTDPKVQILASRWMALVKQFSGGDQGIETTLGVLWSNEGPALASQFGMDGISTDPTMQECMEYVGKALQANGPAS